ncbi:MAG: hypothetical protein LBC94_01340 [Desulfovibrio sp.]|nr:hypothetical protein [Desulfovibrio sp.]
MPDFKYLQRKKMKRPGRSLTSFGGLLYYRCLKIIPIVYLQSLGHSPTEEHERRFISIFRRGMLFEENPPDVLILESQLPTNSN